MPLLRNRLFSVMTWNIYQGSDSAPIFTPSPIPIPERVTEAFRQFLATNFPKRARAIARQIILEKPDLIGLQEAVIVKLIPPSPAKEVVYDFVDILLNELESRGLHYTVAAHRESPAVVLPEASGNNISLIDREAILVRKDSNVKIIQTQHDNFKSNLELEVGNLTFKVVRGWASVDACICGHKFRMVTTHLEPLSTKVQEEQGNELLAGPGQTDLPLIFAGDFNSNASVSGSTTYGNLIAAGFEDTWIIGGHGDGFTCCQDADLLNVESQLSERIDLILIKNRDGWKVSEDELVGEAQTDRTKTRLWPSDHSGVIAKFILRR